MSYLNSMLFSDLFEQNFQESVINVYRILRYSFTYREKFVVSVQHSQLSIFFDYHILTNFQTLDVQM